MVSKEDILVHKKGIKIQKEVAVLLKEYIYIYIVLKMKKLTVVLKKDTYQYIYSATSIGYIDTMWYWLAVVVHVPCMR